MPDVPILGQTKPAPDAEPSFDDLPPEHQQMLRDLAARDEEAQETVATAFLVVQDHDGTWKALLDLTTPVHPTRSPSYDDIIAGLAVITSDVQTTKIAQTTVQGMLQMSQQAQAQMQAQAQEAAIRAQLQRPPKR